MHRAIQSIRREGHLYSDAQLGMRALAHQDRRQVSLHKNPNRGGRRGSAAIHRIVVLEVEEDDDLPPLVGPVDED